MARATQEMLDADLQFPQEPERRRGYWVPKPSMYRHPNARNWYCSECRYEPLETKRFCPLCGSENGR